MRVSIVIPCYNAEKYIAQMCESVLCQSYRNLELVIVDDGSTDNSAKIIKSYAEKDKRIILIQQINSGKPSIARNVAIKALTGDIICFLDADDIYTENKITAMVNIFNTHQDVDFVFHDHAITNEKLTPIVQSHIHKSLDESEFNNLFISTEEENTYHIQKSLYKTFLFKKVLIWTGSIAIRKKSYPENSVLFNENLICAEDTLLWSYIVSHGKGLYYDKVLSFYRDSIGSVTEKIDILDYDTYKYYRINLLYPHEELTASERKILIERATADILSAAYQQSKQNNYHGAMRKYLEAIRFNLSRTTITHFIKFSLRFILRK